jgi:LysM repeat protein
MVRSASALLAVLILSGFVAMQQVATHTVVRGDTLWDLADHYYNDPFQWRRIWEANRDKINDPNLIYPDQVFALPGREAAVSAVTVEPAAGLPAAQPTQQAQQRPAARQPVAPPPQASMASQRTIFYRDTTVAGATMEGRSAETWTVSPVMVLAAPWLIHLDEEPAHVGRIDRFAGGASFSQTVRAYDRVRLTFEGEPPQAGTRLLAFRPDKVIDKVGRVMVPTGVVTISEVDGNEAAAVVSREVERMTLGDLLRPLPEYEPTMERPQAVSVGGEAMIMGFAGPNVVQDVGSIAFLDQGADDGVRIGDEYAYLNAEAGAGVVEGRLQVVGTTSGIASARVVSMDDVVFHQGLVVRLARKMR